jgi:hypothetical protein
MGHLCRHAAMVARAPDEPLCSMPSTSSFLLHGCTG